MSRTPVRAKVTVEVEYDDGATATYEFPHIKLTEPGDSLDLAVKKTNTMVSYDQAPLLQLFGEAADEQRWTVTENATQRLTLKIEGDLMPEGDPSVAFIVRVQESAHDPA